MAHDYFADVKNVIERHLASHKYDPIDEQDELFQDLLDRYWSEDRAYIAPDFETAKEWVTGNMDLLIPACDYDEKEAERMLQEEPWIADIKIREEVTDKLLDELFQ